MKKILWYTGITAVLLICTFAFACAQKDVRPVYTVTFISDEGAVLREEKIKRGEQTDAPAADEKPGYEAYWADEDGNRIAFPKTVAADETYYLKYAPSLVKNAYKTEFYFENADGAFERNDALTQSYDALLGSALKLYPSEFEGYEFDADNPLCVLEGTTRADAVVVLKAYYRLVRINVRYFAGGVLIGEREAMKGRPFSPEITAPEQEGKKFGYWSLEENGSPYDFSGGTEDIVLYAVYTDRENFTVTFKYPRGVKIGALSHSAMSETEESAVFNVEPGDEFGFTILLDDEAVGAPEVESHTVTDAGVVGGTLACDEKGVYRATVSGDMAVTVSGVSLRSYNVLFALAVGKYDSEWAVPYDFSQDLYLIAEREGGTTVHKAQVVNRVASVVIEAGSYFAQFFVTENGEYKPVSQPVSFETAGREDAFFYDGDVYMLHDVVTSGTFSRRINGDVYTSSGEMSLTFVDSAFGTSDYAITVSMDQLFDGSTAIPHGNDAEAAPRIGFYFENADGKRAELTMYDVGSTVIACENEVSEKFASLCTAGSILGKPEWGDCYRHAEITYAKIGNAFYVLFTGDGEGGGVYANGQAFAPTTAVPYSDFLIYYIDLEEGVAYYNADKRDNAFRTAEVKAAAEVLKNVKACGFMMNMIGGGSTYARIYGYGVTTAAEDIAGIKAVIDTKISVSIPAEAKLYLNGAEYDGGEVLVPQFSTAIIDLKLPAGKIIDKFTDGGQNAPFTVSGDTVTYVVEAMGNGGMHDINVTFKPGEYTSETSVFINTEMADGLPEKYDLSRIGARFYNAETDEWRYAHTVAPGRLGAVLERGEWTAYVTGGYVYCDAFSITAGESRTLEMDVTFDKTVAATNFAVRNGGLIYNASDDALHINGTNYLQQDTDVGGITFIPDKQTLEFGYTLTGMRTCDVGTYYYPFLGMYVRDSVGGWMRFVNREDGGHIGFMLADDYSSRTLISYGGDDRPFATATGNYTWANDKLWVQQNRYRLDIRVRISGYEISVWAKTGENPDGDWIEVIPAGSPINVYEWYDSDQAAQVGNRRQYLSTLYDSSKPCTFGITARRDNGHRDDITFSDIWYSIEAR